MKFVLTVDIDELPEDLEYDMRRLFLGFAETACGRKWEPYHPKVNTKEILTTLHPVKLFAAAAIRKACWRCSESRAVWREMYETCSLAEANKPLLDKLIALEQENEKLVYSNHVLAQGYVRLREALEFYADPDNYTAEVSESLPTNDIAMGMQEIDGPAVLDDCGSVAIDALSAKDKDVR